MEGPSSDAALLAQAYAEHWVTKRIASAGMETTVTDVELTEILSSLYMAMDPTLTPALLSAALAHHLRMLDSGSAASGWASLSLDELGCIFAMLSFEERKRVAAVCSQWRRAAFRIDDPRQLRTQHVLSASGPDRVELERWLDQSRSVGALGRIDARRLLVCYVGEGSLSAGALTWTRSV